MTFTLWLVSLSVSILVGYLSIKRIINKSSKYGIYMLWLVYDLIVVICCIIFVLISYSLYKLGLNVNIVSSQGLRLSVLLISVLFIVPFLTRVVPKNISSELVNDEDDINESNDLEIEYTPVEKASLIMYFKSLSLLIWFVWVFLLFIMMIK